MTTIFKFPNTYAFGIGILRIQPPVFNVPTTYKCDHAYRFQYLDCDVHGKPYVRVFKDTDTYICLSAIDFESSFAIQEITKSSSV